MDHHRTMAASTPMLSAILALFVAVTITVGSAAAVGESTAIEGVCVGLGGYYVTPEMCMSALCPGPLSPSPSSPRLCHAARDAPAVAAIAARVAAANAIAARDSLEAALSSNTTAGKAAIRSCLQLYGGVVPVLQWAARSVAAGHFRGAREVMQAAQRVPAGCDGMAEGAAAALPSENDGFAMTATVTHAVLASLSKGY